LATYGRIIPGWQQTYSKGKSENINFYSPTLQIIIDSLSSSNLNKHLSLAKFYYQKSEYDSSLKTLNEIKYLFESENIRKSISGKQICDFLFWSGLNYYQNKDWNQSEKLLQKTINIAKDIKSDSLIVVSLKTIGNINFNKREYGTALNSYQKSLMYLNEYEPSFNVLKSSILQNIGISFSMLNLNDSALYYLEKSLLLKESFLPVNDVKIVSGYVNISRLYQIIGDLSEALRYIDKAEEYYYNSINADSSILGPIYYNKGSILLALSDYDNALQYHELAIQVYKMQLDSQSEIFSELYYNVGLIYANLDSFENAIKFLKSCASSTMSKDQNIKVNFQLGFLYLKEKMYIQAEKFLKHSVLIAESFGLEKNLSSANSYLYYGIFCEQTNDYNKALKYYLKAAKTYKEIFGEKSRDLSNTYTHIGNYFLNLKKTNEALHYFQKALITYVPGFEDTVYFTNPEKIILEPDLNLFYTLAGKSRALYQNYLNNCQQSNHLQVCVETLELSIDLYEKIRANLYSENTKLIIAERVNEIYNLATTAAYELYTLQREFKYLEKTFRFSEKSKAAVLLSTIKENEAIMIGNIPENTRLKEKNLKKQINQYQNILFEENQNVPLDSSKISNIRNNLFKARISYDSLISELEKNYPDYYNLKYNKEVVTIRKVKEMLTNEYHALIEYKIIDSALYTFLIRKDTAIVIKSNIDTTFLENIYSYYNLNGNLPQVENAKSKSYEFAKLGFKISDLLHLNNPSLIGIKRITIIPDDIIGYLSFDALLYNMPKFEESSYRTLDYLIKKYTFSYGYSATLFFKNGFKRKNYKNKVLAIAPTYEHLKDTGNSQSYYGMRDLAKYLIPLPNAIAEVKQVTSILDGDAFIGSDATEGKFKESLEEYGILHFAMHTLINDEEPLASKLIFTIDQDSLNDGFLNTYEIYNLDLNAGLAVLSACKTGIGKLRKGEGIMSLARGFLFAGVPGIIMTLWAVEDIASANIISDFYRNLSKGDSKDIALRNAKLTFLENADQFTAHPYFWAAYVQIGDKKPIKKKNNLYIPVGSVLAVSLIVLLYFVLKRRAKKRSA
jgi:CHAT domain-containing protein/TPR repeat protein